MRRGKTAPPVGEGVGAAPPGGRLKWFISCHRKMSPSSPSLGYKIKHDVQITIFRIKEKVRLIKLM